MLLETLYLSNPTITETPMVGIIIRTPDRAESVVNNILKSGIPPKNGCRHGEERDKKAKKTDSTVTKKCT